jgi:hypothetical protein
MIRTTCTDTFFIRTVRHDITVAPLCPNQADEPLLYGSLFSSLQKKNECKETIFESAMTVKIRLRILACSLDRRSYLSDEQLNWFIVSFFPFLLVSILICLRR